MIARYRTLAQRIRLELDDLERTESGTSTCRFSRGEAFANELRLIRMPSMAAMPINRDRRANVSPLPATINHQKSAINNDKNPRHRNLL
jgi:hypothetical protein